MTCEPFCDLCGGNLGRPSNGDNTCDKCKDEAHWRERHGNETVDFLKGDQWTREQREKMLRKCRKEHIRKDEFDPSNPAHFRLQSRGGAWRYYRKVEPVIVAVDPASPGGDMSVKVTRRGDEIISIERLD